MSNLEKKQTGKIYTNLGEGKYSYWYPDGGLFLANEFGSKHKSAGLEGPFECYWYPKNAKKYGFWRKYKTSQRVYFEEKDIMNTIFQGKLLTEKTILTERMELRIPKGYKSPGR